MIIDVNLGVITKCSLSESTLRWSPHIISFCMKLFLLGISVKSLLIKSLGLSVASELLTTYTLKYFISLAFSMLHFLRFTFYISIGSSLLCGLLSSDEYSKRNIPWASVLGLLCSLYQCFSNAVLLMRPFYDKVMNDNVVCLSYTLIS